jgi:hypothetical protein
MHEPNESSGQAVSHDRKTANHDHKANRGQETDRQEEMHRPANQVRLAKLFPGM